MITFVYWLYRGERDYYKAEHINAQLFMLENFAEEDFQVVCVTDTPEGINSKIQIIPCPVDDGAIEPTDKRFPRCYRKLWNWSQDATILGERICSIDLDTVIVGPWKKLVSRKEPCVMWRGRGKILLGGAYLLDTGSYTSVWDDFDFALSPIKLREKRLQESDQGWLNYVMPKDIPTWNKEDGILHPTLKLAELPKGTSVVSFGGIHKPWHKQSRIDYPWIDKFYPLEPK